MTFSKPVKGTCVGLKSESPTFVCSCVVPMGWCSAVNVTQMAVRYLCLRLPPSGAGWPGINELRKDRASPVTLLTPIFKAWLAYLDNAGTVESMDSEIAAALEGTPSEWQQSLRAAMDELHIPWDPQKSLQRQSRFKSLGDRVDGRRGIVDCPEKSFWSSSSV